MPTLSIDTDSIFELAFGIVESMMPLIAVIAGLGLGFNLVSKISRLFSAAF